MISAALEESKRITEDINSVDDISCESKRITEDINSVDDECQSDRERSFSMNHGDYPVVITNKLHHYFRAPREGV